MAAWPRVTLATSWSTWTGTRPRFYAAGYQSSHRPKRWGALKGKHRIFNGQTRAPMLRNPFFYLREKTKEGYHALICYRYPLLASSDPYSSPRSQAGTVRRTCTAECPSTTPPPPCSASTPGYPPHSPRYTSRQCCGQLSWASVWRNFVLSLTLYASNLYRYGTIFNLLGFNFDLDDTPR